MISIVTLSYNCSKQLIKTCNSILNQLVPPSEHIIIDNNSSDDTKYKIDKLRERYKNKGKELIFISEQDKGISDGFNKGISICKNSIIALFNSGDTYFETTIKAVINNFENEDEIWKGNPTRFIRKRFDDEEIEYLEQSKRWPWNIDNIKNNKQFFNSKDAI